MAFLILADGTLFPGKSVGVQTYALGEMVFNTSQTGYQEILTDPSYHGQIINFTMPHIGNVGVNLADNESKKIHAAGAIFRDFSTSTSYWRAENHLHHFLLSHGCVALSEVDTRALTLHLRDHGSQQACLVATDTVSPAQALQMAKQHPTIQGLNLAKWVSTKEVYVYDSPPDPLAHLVVVDCGVKTGILKNLLQHSLKITVVPESIGVEALQALSPDGVLLSNGPGDPAACDTIIALARHLLHEKIPLFGICLGHQIMALAAGAKTKKMKFGHHGANHPIQCSASGQVLISTQNHGFVVDEAHLPDDLQITHLSLFDGTIAGLTHRYAPARSFQGHPEANPGPNELRYLFKKFIEEVVHAKKHSN